MGWFQPTYVIPYAPVRYWTLDQLVKGHKYLLHVSHYVGKDYKDNVISQFLGIKDMLTSLKYGCLFDKMLCIPI
jgi:hypothetical protein